MGLFDSLINHAENSIASAVNSGSRRAVNSAMKGADQLAHKAVNNIRRRKPLHLRNFRKLWMN